MSVREEKRKQSREEEEIEIRLSDIVQFLKDSRRTVLSWAFVGLVIGALYAWLQPDEYTAYVSVMPELQAKGGSGLGNLSSLAGLAGINLDAAGSAEAIRPDLYPTMLQSIPFGLYMLNQTVRADNRQFTVQDYLTWSAENSTDNRVRQTLFGWLSSDNGKAARPVSPRPQNPAQPLQLTNSQEGAIGTIKKRVFAEIDKRTGVLTITAKMPDPAVAATLARLALDYLTTYVTNYRTGRSRQQVQFLSQQVSTARRRYEAAEYGVSNYRDRNRSLFLNTAKIEEQRLQADYLLAQSLYNELSKQLEQARIKVQEEAPVFQVLEPARVPLQKSDPKRTTITTAFTIFGAMLGLCWFFVRWFVRRQSI